jgi:hypothetical protein
MPDLAEEHWAWLGPLLERIYVDAMRHGYKHGRADKADKVSKNWTARDVNAEIRKAVK